jgi:CRISPR/Cas system CSM-associated protein Csm3 (group 7 of RAMP superfamily)
MAEFRVNLTIRVETALSVGGAGTVGTLADKSLLRDGWNRPILPASQVKGRLRHACEAIARGLGIAICEGPVPEMTCPHLADEQIPLVKGQRCCFICQIFGSPGYRGKLLFRDLVYIPATRDPVEQGHLYAPHEPLRPGVGLERRRGVVQEKLLFLTETTLPGTGSVFRADSAIYGNLPRVEHALLVLMGLEQILNWGGAKSRGLGWARIDYTASYGENGDFTLADEKGKEALTRLCTSS